MVHIIYKAITVASDTREGVAGANMVEKRVYHMPRCKKVCCCIPLRRGIILLVYVNVVIAALGLFSFALLKFFDLFARGFTGTYEENSVRLRRYKLNLQTTILIFCGSALAEVVMTFVAFVGLHKKNLKLIRVYLFYTAGITALMVPFCILDISPYLWRWQLLVLAVYISYKLFYIVNIRSQVKKMEEAELAEVAHTVELNAISDDLGSPQVESVLNVPDDEKLIFCVNKESQP